MDRLGGLAMPTVARVAAGLPPVIRLRRIPWARLLAMLPWQREQARAKGRARRAANLERARAATRAWRARNPAARTVARHLRRSRLVGGRFTAAEWRELLVAWHGLCAYCSVGGKMTVDHRVPLSRGGTNDISNVLPACMACNTAKHTKTESEFHAWTALSARPGQE